MAETEVLIHDLSKNFLMSLFPLLSQFPHSALLCLSHTHFLSTRNCIFSQLVADGNEKLLERAEAAALVVCLDDHAPETRSEVARSLWHGDGRNRHFDKSVQIVVFSNGKAGLVGEHSMMDGMPVRLYYARLVS